MDSISKSKTEQSREIINMLSPLGHNALFMIWFFNTCTIFSLKSSACKVIWHHYLFGVSPELHAKEDMFNDMLMLMFM